MNEVIKTVNLTKDYGEGKGIFDINLDIKEGEMFGFVGTNGSGKTTTIRNIMGFIKPTSGHAEVNGKESWKYSNINIRDIGYVAGEIAFPDLPTGTDFLNSQAEFLGLKNMDYADYLIKRLQLDPHAPLRRMSKGMKQKTAIVAALMGDPKIIILDEPTTGLDPLMRETFLEIIQDEHKKGKTIFMSSHIFEELERTCDRVALIQDGHIKDICDVEKIKNRNDGDFKIEFLNEKDYLDFKKLNYKIIRDQPQYNQVTINISNEHLNDLFKDLKNYKLKFIAENKLTLEKYFKDILKKEEEKVVMASVQ